MPEEIKQEVVLKTQKYLSKYVKKPPLSDKLLKKPPFRFLHDVINAVIKETGFLKGLFTDEELNSDNVKERDAKVAFLGKLIEAVKVITNTDLAARPSKIVAGLEPTETNLLLQAIGKAIEKKTDSTEYINQLQSGQIISNDKNKKTKKTSEKFKKSSKTSLNDEEKQKTSSRNKEKQVPTIKGTPKSTDRDKKRSSKESKIKNGLDDGMNKSKEKNKKKETKEVKKEKIELVETKSDKLDSPKQAVLETVKETVKSSEEIVTDAFARSASDAMGSGRSAPEESVKASPETKADAIDNDTRKRGTSASRPKSARPRSGDRDLREKITTPQEIKEPVPISSRPKSALRPPSVRPSSARPGAPRLRPDSGFPIKEVVAMGKINVIVENFDKDADEEETVVIQSNPEVIEEQKDALLDVPGDNKGHLVEQILEQINEADENTISTTITDKGWQKKLIYQGKDKTVKETNNLRSMIQSLTKTANPLGKLLNYLHEDIDAMHAELESWGNIKRQLFDEIAKQKKVSIEMNKPLILQLDHLTKEIKKVEEEIADTRSNILRNELKIQDLLIK